MMKTGISIQSSAYLKDCDDLDFILLAQEKNSSTLTLYLESSESQALLIITYLRVILIGGVPEHEPQYFVANHVAVTSSKMKKLRDLVFRYGERTEKKNIFEALKRFLMSVGLDFKETVPEIWDYKDRKKDLNDS